MNNPDTELPKMILFSDPPYANLIFSTLLSAWGELTRAWNPAELEAAVRAGARLVISDEVRWSELSPEQRKLLREEADSSRLRVIVLSEKLQRAEQLEPPVHRLLPISTPPGQVADALYQVLRTREESAAPPRSGTGERRILVVDDSELLNSITCTTLGNAGYRARSVTNPIEVYQRLRLDPPDLLLVDYNIPALRGDLLIQIIRTAGIDIPMVFYSNAPEATLDAAVRRCGALGYIRKGVAVTVLLERVDFFYQKVERLSAKRGDSPGGSPP